MMSTVRLDGAHQVTELWSKHHPDEFMPYGCQSLVAVGSRVYGFSTEGFVMIAEQGKTSVSCYRLPMQFDHIYGVTGSGVAVLGSGSTVYLLNLS